MICPPCDNGDSAQIHFNYLAVIPDSLTRTLYTLGNEVDGFGTGELNSPDFSITLSNTDIIDMISMKVRACGYDQDLNLRWSTKWEESAFRIFADLDTLRTEDEIPIHHVWGYDDPLLSRHWICKVVPGNFEQWVLTGDSLKTRALYLMDWLIENSVTTPLDGIAVPETFDFESRIWMIAPWSDHESPDSAGGTLPGDHQHR